MNDGEKQRRFETLLREHQRIIFKIAATFARRSEDRQDLAQEIAVQLWRSFPRYDERLAKFSTWMYRIALNVAISEVRRTSTSLISRSESIEGHHLDPVAHSEPQTTEDERVAGLWAFIDQLNKLDRGLMLLYLEERSYAEMAEILGISETNVATKINRIKRKLRRTMTEAQTRGTI